VIATTMLQAMPALAGEHAAEAGTHAAAGSSVASIGASIADPGRLACGRGTGGTISVSARDGVPPPEGAGRAPDLQVDCTAYRGPTAGGAVQAAAPDARWAGRMLGPRALVRVPSDRPGGPAVIEIITNYE